MMKYRIFVIIIIILEWQNVSPHISHITSHKSSLKGAQGHTWQLIRGDWRHSCLEGVQKIHSQDRLTIPSDWIDSLWPTEYVPAPLNIGKGRKWIFQLNSSSYVTAVVLIVVGGRILVRVWCPMIVDDGVTNLKPHTKRWLWVKVLNATGFEILVRDFWVGTKESQLALSCKQRFHRPSWLSATRRAGISCPTSMPRSARKICIGSNSVKLLIPIRVWGKAG